MDPLYTTHDISRLLQVDPSTISKWIDRGLLMAFRTPGRHRRVRATDLRTFLVAHQMPVPTELGSGLVKLLAVDDEKPVLDGLRRAFKPFAAQVELLTTTSGVEALLMVSEQKPHGLLIDLNMPDLDGLEVIRRVRSHKQLEGVRCIAMTARQNADLVEQALKAGAATCVFKPVDVQQVMDLFKIPLAMAPRA